MPNRRTNSNTATAIKADINKLAASILSKKAKNSASESERSKPANNGIVPSNSFAQKLFFDHTNIKQIIAEEYPERSESSRLQYAEFLYKKYLTQPKMRIRKRLCRVRFKSRYYEGVFRMATQIPLLSANEFDHHKQTLENAGIRKLAFVDMTLNNCVLVDQQKVIRNLAKFSNWSDKLEKLPKYLTECQRQREQQHRKHSKQKLRKLLTRHSNLKHNLDAIEEHVMDLLVEELSTSCENRCSLIWRNIRFDDPCQDRIYSVGKYAATPLLPEPPRPILIDDLETDRQPVTYSLEYVKKCTNIYKVVLSEHLEKWNNQNTNITQVLVDRHVLYHYGSHASTFERRELPKNIRLLTEDEQLEQKTKGVLAWALEQISKDAEPSQATNDSQTNDNANHSTQSKPAEECIPSSSSALPALSLLEDTFMNGVSAEERIPNPPSPWPTLNELQDTPTKASSTQDQDRSKKQREMNTNPQPPVQGTQKHLSAPSWSPSQNRNRHRKKDMLFRTQCAVRPGVIEYEAELEIETSGRVTCTGDRINDPPPSESQQEPPALEDRDIPSPERISSSPEDIDLTTRPSSYNDEVREHSPCPNTQSFMPIQSSTQQPGFPDDVAALATQYFAFSQISPRPPEKLEQMDSPQWIPPLQPVDPSARISISSEDSPAIKHEPASQREAMSMYDQSIEFIESNSHEVICISDDEQSDAMFLANFPEDNPHIAEATLTSRSPEVNGSSSKIAAAESPAIVMPFMGKFVTFDARRPCTQFAPVSSIPDVCPSTGIESCSGPAHPSLLALLPRIIIQSIRYSTHPIKWSHCNVFQQNKLTVNLLPGTAGILSASICGNQAYELFGLAFGSKGRSALIAAFTAVGKFRYGIQEPTLKIFDDMPVTEKVLHLFFDVLPEFPQNGGFALYVDSDTFNPTGVKKSRLERFNYYLHTRAGQHSSGAATSDENDGDECLARFLMPGIAKNMAKLRAKMRGQS